MQIAEDVIDLRRQNTLCVCVVVSLLLIVLPVGNIKTFLICSKSHHWGIQITIEHPSPRVERLVLHHKNSLNCSADNNFVAQCACVDNAHCVRVFS